jgi:hypothetical protein
MFFFGGDSKQEIQLWAIGEDWLSLFKEHGEIKGQIFNFMFMHISMNHLAYKCVTTLCTNEVLKHFNLNMGEEGDIGTKLQVGQ